jgi:hypothetical protein
MTTFLSVLRSTLLIILMTTAMVMLVNNAQADVMSTAQFYANNADRLKEEAARLEAQTKKALKLHQQLLQSEIGTREAFHNYLYQLTTAEKHTDDILNPARFRIGIPSKRGIKAEQYPAIKLSLDKDLPYRTRTVEIRDLVKKESRRYKEVLKDNEQAFVNVEEVLASLEELREDVDRSRTDQQAKRTYEHYLRRLSSAKQLYYKALDEFCIAAAQAEFRGLTGRRLAPSDSPFQLYPSQDELSQNDS